MLGLVSDGLSVEIYKSLLLLSVRIILGLII